MREWNQAAALILRNSYQRVMAEDDASLRWLAQGLEDASFGITRSQ